MMKHFIYSLVLASSLLLSLPTLAAPKVVVSIKPLHDVALFIMEGASTPSLLVPPGASPHYYALTPSQAQALGQADIIVWVGPSLESFLVKPLEKRQAKAQLISVLDIPGLTLYPIQTHSDKPDHKEHDHGAIDPHLWLDPMNLITFAKALTESLAQQDPTHASLYHQNLDQFIQAITKLDKKLTEQLSPVQSMPIMVFHDAYQYFEKRYRLRVVGVILPNPHLTPTVPMILAIQQQIQAEKVACIFTEPQFQPALVNRLISNTGIGQGVLDPLGKPTPTGLAGTETLFEDLAHHIIACKKNETP